MFVGIELREPLTQPLETEAEIHPTRQQSQQDSRTRREPKCDDNSKSPSRVRSEDHGRSRVQHRPPSRKTLEPRTRLWSMSRTRSESKQLPRSKPLPPELLPRRANEENEGRIEKYKEDIKQQQFGFCADPSLTTWEN